MQKYLLLLLAVFIVNPTLLAQLSAPNVENVYGGRINAITGYSHSADTTRIFISTESANSIFYADVYQPSTGSPVVGSFNKLQSADADNNFGGGVKSFAAHSSGYLFWGWNDGVYTANPAATTATKIISGGNAAVLIEGSVMLALDGGNLHTGTIDAAGTYTAASGSPFSVSLPPSMYSISVHPSTGLVYFFSSGSSPSLDISSSAYNAIGSTTTYTSVSLSPLGTATDWTGFGISPSGRLFAAGHSGGNKYIAYSDDGASWTIVNTGIQGVTGSNISFGGASASYYVYTSAVYSNNMGIAGSWLNFGNPGGMETHPNDGSTYVDPLNYQMVYMTTDQGIGASDDRGSSIFEINDGVEAVQVDDFDMTSSKNTAWLASKAGIRKVTNYLTSPLWTNAIFPNGDGSPYFSAEMIPGDTNTVYVGNLRVYKTTNSGSTWSQVFTAEAAPYNFPSVGSEVQAIEVCDYDHSTVFAGYYLQGSSKGGLFYSTDNGNTWSQILLHASSSGQDVDVYDIVFNKEGSDTIAYVGVEYDLSAPTGRSVYKLTKNGASWTVSQDMNGSTTSTGTVIVATIRDLLVSSTGDTIFGCGTDAGINHPIVYYKPLTATGKWTPFTTTGFPFVSGKQGKAISLGMDTLYCAVDNEIYYFPLSAASWYLGYTYPSGTNINVLYYDDLLVGTGTGLFGHHGLASTSTDEPDYLPENFVLIKNYPNPFNPATTIYFSIPAAGQTSLRIYDILGNEIKTLINEQKEAGTYTAFFDASGLTTGVYIATLRTGVHTQSIKISLLK
ncbi:MAG: hypothetical protein AMXMBFR48_16100 [Ignavibacteriales bacterium]